MKHLVLLPAFVLALAACGGSPPPRALTPPSPAIVALAGTPVPLSPSPNVSPVPVTTEHTHPHWSITVPSAWKVSKDADDGLDVISDVRFGRAPIAVSVIASTVGDDMTPEAFAMGVSVMAPTTMLPSGQEVDSLASSMIEFIGVPTSVTTIITKQGIGIGILALEQQATHTGYVLLCIADANAPGNGKLCAEIHKTFTLR
jgi:hypothetical protein